MNILKMTNICQFAVELKLVLQLKKATIAVKEMRGRSIMGCRLQTDYAR